MVTLTKRPHDQILSFLSAKARKSMTTARGGGKWHLNAMLYMAPAKEAGYGNVCISARDCIKDCLWRSGQVLRSSFAKKNNKTLWEAVQKYGWNRQEMINYLAAQTGWKHSAPGIVDGFFKRKGASPADSVRESRIENTRRWFQDKDAFLEDIYCSIASMLKSIPSWQRKMPAAFRKEGVPEGVRFTPVVRLNGTSDLFFEEIRFQGKTFMEHFPDLTFYDYTKHWWRALGFAKRQILDKSGKSTNRPWPKNYHLTFSMGGFWDEKIKDLLEQGCNVTMVFDSHHGVPTSITGPLKVRDHAGQSIDLPLPKTPVIYGDEDDLRFLDPPGHIVGLKYKKVEGNTRDPGFVLQVPGDTEAMFAAILFEKREDAEVRQNPDEQDLLGDGPTGTFIPGEINPLWIPPGAAGDGPPTNDHSEVYRLGCGGFGYGKPMRYVP